MTRFILSFFFLFGIPFQLLGDGDVVLARFSYPILQEKKRVKISDSVIVDNMADEVNLVSLSRESNFGFAACSFHIGNMTPFRIDGFVGFNFFSGAQINPNFYRIEIGFYDRKVVEFYLFFEREIYECDVFSTGNCVIEDDNSLKCKTLEDGTLKIEVALPVYYDEVNNCHPVKIIDRPDRTRKLNCIPQRKTWGSDQFFPSWDSISNQQGPLSSPDDALLPPTRNYDESKRTVSAFLVQTQNKDEGMIGVDFFFLSDSDGKGFHHNDRLSTSTFVSQNQKRSENQQINYVASSRLRDLACQMARKEYGVQESNRSDRVKNNNLEDMLFYTSGWRTRFRFENWQVMILEKSFSRSQYLTMQDKSQLSTWLGVNKKRISNWFKNRRSKFKKNNAKALTNNCFKIRNRPCVLKTAHQ